MRNVPCLTPTAAIALSLCFAALSSCRSSHEGEPKKDAAELEVSELELALKDVESANLGAGPGSSTRVGAQDGGLQDDVTRLSLAEQKKRFLVERHLERARDLRDQSRLDEALAEATAAFQLDDENPEARALLNELRVLSGDGSQEAGTVLDIVNSEYAVRMQQLRADVGDALRSGRAAIARNDYDTAIQELTVATNTIRFAPFTVDWGGIDQEAQSLPEQARRDRDSAMAAERERKERIAYDRLRAEEEAKGARERQIVDNIIEQSVAHFERGEYEQAQELAEQALRRAPRDERALELKEASFRAGRDKVRSDYVAEKRERFAEWVHEIDELRVPWTDVITLPDPEDWAAVSAKREKRPGLDPKTRIDPAEDALRDRLAKTSVPALVIESESLAEVVEQLKAITGLPLIVAPPAQDAAESEGIVYDFKFTSPLSARQLLDNIAKQSGENVTWMIKNDAVIFTTKEKARGKPVIKNHAVQDLVFGLTDFLGPRIDRIRLLDELEDDDGGGPFGGIAERVQLIEEEDIQTLITENVAVGTWEDEGISIDVGEGFIVVVHTHEVQAQVGQFLEDLRRFAGSLVTIESKFLTVSDNYLQEIGVDFRGSDNRVLSDVTNGLEDMASRGLDNGGTGSSGQNAAGNPSAGAYYNDGGDGEFLGTTQNFFGNGLGDALSSVGGLSFQLTFLNDLEVSTILRAVEKSSKLELINNQVLSVHNTQRAFVAVINQQAYIQDFDVEVAQFQAVADPQINVLTEGVVLDVRPIIGHDRKYLTLEIQPTVAKVVALRDFSSTLGGNTSPVEFQLPELEVQSVFTTAFLPDGGSILLGGLSNVRNIERRAEVPWMARIPIVGFLFKQEGYNDEKDSLKILIKARITDVREETDKISARY